MAYLTQELGYAHWRGGLIGDYNGPRDSLTGLL